MIQASAYEANLINNEIDYSTLYSVRSVCVQVCKVTFWGYLTPGSRAEMAWGGTSLVEWEEGQRSLHVCACMCTVVQIEHLVL